MDIPAVSNNLRRYSRSRNSGAPPHSGTRFDAIGRFLPEPGNTIVCHLAEGSETQRALIDARARFLAMPESGNLAFTPISSLHMTLFQGIIEYRRKDGYWPHDIALDTPIDDMTEMLGHRLLGFEPGPAFKVAVTEALPTGLTVEGATEADRQALRAWRDRLARLFGYRHPDHETYGFHITFAYMVDWIDEDAQPAWQAMLTEVVEDIRRRAPVLELNPPAFCAFKDMNHFEELLVLGD